MNEEQIIKSMYKCREHELCVVEPIRAMIVFDGLTTSQIVTSTCAYWQYIIYGGETVRFVRVSFVHLFIWPVARNFLDTDRKGNAHKNIATHSEGVIHITTFINLKARLFHFSRVFPSKKIHCIRN